MSDPSINQLEQLDRELETILTSFDTNYAWNYGSVKEGLRDLYEKAKREQWNATTDLPWETSVDLDAELVPAAANPLADWQPYQRLDAAEAKRFDHAMFAWQLSQFLHGEQGALLAASQLVAAVPWMDAKHYAATQTLDEARHVEVFSRYVEEKLEWEWPINPNLKSLLDAILLESRWDLKYLGMQILVEGLAMGAFANLHQLVQEPLLKQLLHNVMRDESRHVAFGVLSLDGYYRELPASELRDREDFAIETCQLMRDRLVGEEVADVAGFDRAALREQILASPVMQQFRQLLFARVVPNVKSLGLLSDRQRQRFADLGILEFETNTTSDVDQEIEEERRIRAGELEAPTAA